MSTFSEEALNLAGLDAAAEGSEVAPREEPFLEPHRLDKPVLDIYAGGSDDLEHQLLENPDSGHQWMRAHENTFVDVEAHR